MVFDTLYGQNGRFEASPQMVEGHTVENNGLLWKLRLREGLKWHDGEPVLARDCVASIPRWAARDAYGGTLMGATAEFSVLDDRIIQFRLKRPFPLPDALGKLGGYVAFILPERLADPDPAKIVTEIIGSGPFRYLAGERVSGARNVYERFPGYVPRPDGTTDVMAGPKLAHFDRVEWHTIPDAATAATALQTGEMDWWEQPTADLLPALRQHRDLTVELLDTIGFYAFRRPNHLQKPFNNPAFRRAVLGAINQADYMTATAGTDQSLWRDGVGFFLPGGPMDTTAGINALNPSVHAYLRGTGASGQWGWPDSPALEAMRTEWFNGVTGDAERTLGARMQAQAFQDVPYMPTGIFFQPTAHHRSLVDLPKMFALFYGVKRRPS